MKKNNIILIGMMGSGKTTISSHLCKKNNYNFIDTDENIEATEKISIPEIFEKFGEKYFRDCEHKELRSLELNSNSVISTGGGIILNPKNTEILKKQGVVIYLRGSVDTLYNRLIENTENRPLLAKNELYAKLTKLLSDRKNMYEEAAELIIDIDEKDISCICSEIYAYITSI